MAPVLPAWSVARMRTCWMPSGRLVRVKLPVVGGEAHAVKNAWLKLQANVTPASLPVKVTVASVALVAAAGAPVTVTVGAIVSTVHCQLSDAETLPAASTAWASRLCAPSLRPLAAKAPVVAGDEQEASAAPSRLHRKVAFGSLELSVNAAFALLVR